jgi:hypothetical protein
MLDELPLCSLAFHSMILESLNDVRQPVMETLKAAKCSFVEK